MRYCDPASRRLAVFLVSMTLVALCASEASGAQGLEWSTFLGGSAADEGYGIAVDTAGDAYVTGYTRSVDFPSTAGVFDTSFDGADIFVAKLASADGALLYGTSLGGGGLDLGYGVALDTAGNAHVTGRANSFNFPTTPGAFDTT